MCTKLLKPSKKLKNKTTTTKNNNSKKHTKQQHTPRYGRPETPSQLVNIIELYDCRIL